MSRLAVVAAVLVAVAQAALPEISVTSNTADTVQIVMEGAEEKFMGCGFGSQTMENTYAIIAKADGTVIEHKLGNHVVGTDLSSSITVVSNTVVGGVRTVTLTREMTGASNDHFTFQAGAIDMLRSTGSTAFPSYHAEKEPSSITLVAFGSAAGTNTPSSGPNVGDTSGTSVVGAGVAATLAAAVALAVA